MGEEKKEIIIETGMLDIYLGQEGKQLAGKTFPRKVNYWLARLYDKLRREFKTYINQRDEIIKKYYDEEESKKRPPGQFFIQPENREAYNKELEELTSQVIRTGLDLMKIDEKDLPKDLSVRDNELLLPILDIKWEDKSKKERK